MTVLYPFVPPAKIDDRVIRTLADALQSVTAFGITFARVAWFGDEVVWLAPEPDQPFRDLISVVSAGFPDYPLYGGTHTELIPHLTIGDRAPVEALRAAARAVEPHLPIEAHIRTALVMQGSDAPRSWQTVAELPLGSPDTDSEQH